MRPEASAMLHEWLTPIIGRDLCTDSARHPAPSATTN
jgi:hypothetical protein